MVKCVFHVLVLLSMTACGNFEYDITRPPEIAQHVGKDQVQFTRDPVEYRMQTFDSRLVILIYNNGDSSINLLGDRSSAVDQKGQSHPLRSVTIAPHSFAKVILPPQRPYIQSTDPTFGFGVIGDARQREFMDDPDYYQPQYFTIYDDDTYYWDWTGETDIRITIVYQQGNQAFEHEFVIARKKV